MAFNAQNTGANMDRNVASGAGDVCDPPHVFNAGPDAQKVVRHVQDDNRRREFEAPRVEETVVHHDVERVQPVIHKEVHQTRLHEATHHKAEAPRDQGITEVVQHRDTDPCGNRVTEDANAVRGTGTTSLRAEYENDKLAGRGNTADIAPASATGYGTTDAYDNTTTTDSTGTTGKPHGIKGLINKVIPGPGPFKEHA